MTASKAAARAAAALTHVVFLYI